MNWYRLACWQVSVLALWRVMKLWGGWWMIIVFGNSFSHTTNLFNEPWNCSNLQSWSFNQVFFAPLKAEMNLAKYIQKFNVTQEFYSVIWLVWNSGVKISMGTPNYSRKSNHLVLTSIRVLMVTSLSVFDLWKQKRYLGLTLWSSNMKEINPSDVWYAHGYGFCFEQFYLYISKWYCNYSNLQVPHSSALICCLLLLHCAGLP